SRPAGPAPQEKSAVPGRNIAGPRIVGCAGAEAPPLCEDCAAAGATAMMDEHTTMLHSTCTSLSRIVMSDPRFSIRQYDRIEHIWRKFFATPTKRGPNDCTGRNRTLGLGLACRPKGRHARSRAHAGRHRQRQL